MSVEADESIGGFHEELEKDELQPYQEIKLTGDDEENIHMINSKDVAIMTTPSFHNSGSSRVKINNIVDFSWERKYHFGHLVASTQSGNYIAYSLIVNKTAGGVVRVTKPKTEQRILIKGFHGQVKDLAFALTLDIILACVDEYGNLLVHKIEDERNQLASKLLLRLERDDSSPSDYHMLFWCPFIPEDAAESSDSVDEATMLLAVTHDNEVEVINVNHLSRKYGPNLIYSKSLLPGSRQVIQQNKAITVATFSPDGSALATGNLDGDVKFFEVSSEPKGQSPSCLHQWCPHDGRPISSLFFLDNRKSHQPDVQFWKFALTGVDCNQELKLWSCESWECLQTIKFLPKDTDVSTAILRAELDSSSGYLMLSDIYNKAVYVLQIYQSFSPVPAYICSIAEFSVTHSILSISIVDASKCTIKITDEIEPLGKNGNDQNGNDDEDEESAESTLSVRGIAVKCFWINVKSLQESRITYQPPVILANQPDDTLSLMSQESTLFRDRLSDLSNDVQDPDSNLSLLDRDINMHIESDLSISIDSSTTPCRKPILSERQDILLTPDDFTSPSHPKQPSLNTTPSLPSLSDTLPPIIPIVSPPEDLNVSALLPFTENLNLTVCNIQETPLATSETIPAATRRKSSQRSSASSPSQEVADILSPLKSLDLVKTDSLIEINQHTEVEENKMNGIESEEMLSPINNEHESLVSPLTLTQAQADFAVWPQAPDLSKEYRLVGKNITQIEKSFSTKPIGSGENIGHSSDAEFKTALLRIQSSLDILNTNVASLSNKSHEHSVDIQELHQQLLKQLEYQRHFQNIPHRLEKLESNVFSHVQKTVTHQSQIDYNKVESLLSRRQEVDRQWLEKQAVEASQNASAAISNKLDKSIKHEMKNVVLPNVSKIMDSWKDQMQQDFVQRMSVSESAIKESMKLLVKNKNFIDNVSQNVAVCIQPQIQGVCKDLFHQHLVPIVERVCQNLFLQLNESFKMGTNEYLKQAQSYVERSTQQMQTNQNAVQAKLEHQVAFQAKANDQFLDTVKTQVQKRMEESWSQMSGTLVSQMRVMVADEVRLAIKELTPNLTAQFADAMGPSRTMTPVPVPLDPQLQQQQIMTFLRNNQYNAAFQQALNAADINLVTFVCENVAPGKVFGQVPCSLKAPVLLSLINQLGTNLSSKTELKMSYLEEAVMNLEANDPLIKGHIGTVVGILRDRLTNFLRQNSNSPFISKIKLLLMATTSLTPS